MSGGRRPLVFWQRPARDPRGRARDLALLAGVTVVIGALIVASLRSLGPESVAFALVIVWLPMTWLGTVSHVVGLQLPERHHALRRFEEDGKVYERLGVRIVKRLLRRGPLAVWNPGLHLPPERTPEQLAALEQRMRTAETTHFVLLVLTLGIVVHAAARGWRLAAGSTLLFDLLVNGYPVMLQRYNRALLRAR